MIRVLVLALVALGAFPSSAHGWTSTVTVPPGATLTTHAYCHPAPDVWLKLDEYRPAVATDRVVLYIHGGSWQYGDRRSSRWLGRMLPGLLGSGRAVASIDYRLAPTWAWSAQIRDAQCAVRWLHAHGYRDVAVIGESAGGQVAALLGTSGAGVSAVVDLYGPTLLTRWTDGYLLTHADLVFLDNWSLRRSASPVSYASAGDPRTLVMTGDADPITPPDQAHALVDRLTAAGVEAEAVIVPGGIHGLEGFDVVGTTLAFLGTQ